MFRSTLFATLIALASSLPSGTASAQGTDARAVIHPHFVVVETYRGDPVTPEGPDAASVINPYYVVVSQDTAAGTCLREGIPSSSGAVSCHADGHLYECRDGSWQVDSRSSCDPVDPPFSAAALALPGDTFIPGDMYLPGDTYLPGDMFQPSTTR